VELAGLGCLGASAAVQYAVDYRIGDCRDVLADIADESVALTLTDPPYAKEAEPLYAWLAHFAARVLIPGGAAVFVTGQTSPGILRCSRPRLGCASGGTSACCTTAPRGGCRAFL
jgi:predicted methyltransferase